MGGESASGPAIERSQPKGATEGKGAWCRSGHGRMHLGCSYAVLFARVMAS